jgi:SHAQKYF class myb-like DNA-binding protein
MTPHSSRQWTADEHARYLAAIDRFPGARWKVIAAHVGTRTPRQVMTHAQKITLKQKRHARGLRSAGRPRGDALKQKQHNATKHKTAPVMATTEKTDCGAWSPLYSATSGFLDMFELDSLADLGSPKEENVGWCQPPGSPTSPSGNTFTFGGFDDSDAILDGFEWGMFPSETMV